MAIFALTTDHGPHWDPGRGIREQEAWAAHAAFMDGLVDDGFLLLGGPLGDGEHTLHMVEAADEREVAARMSEDPWAAMGLLRIGAVERWSIWLGSRPASQQLRRGAPGPSSARCRRPWDPSPTNAMVPNSGLLAGSCDSCVRQIGQKYTAAPLTVDTQASFGTVTGEVSGGLLTFAGAGSFAPPSAADICSGNSGPFSPAGMSGQKARDPAPPGRRLQPQHAAYRRQPAGRRESGRLLRQRGH